MSRRTNGVPFAVPLALTLILLAVRLAAVPALSDPVAGAVPSSLHLSTPKLYLLLGPIFSMWDGVSMLSMSRLKGFLTGLAVLYLLWRLLAAVLRRQRLTWLRESGVFLLSLALLLGFLLLGALWHRPMLSLAGVPNDNSVVDFHSHTRFSHDVAGTWMDGFDVEANRRWHGRAGFDAVFITDHNVVSRESRVAGHQSGVGSRESGGQAGSTVPCPGIEVSAWRAHILLLGDTLPVDRGRYNSSLAALLQLLRTSEAAYASLSVASLPEYRRNHWSRLDTLIQAGLDGLEIVNASPKANELSRAERDSVVSLARSGNLFVVGVSDSHGWGATSMVWNLVRVPAQSSAPDFCDAVLNRLRAGFTSVRVIERHRLRADAWWPMWLTPIGVLWETWRSMAWPLTISWIVWIWLLGTAGSRRRRP